MNKRQKRLAGERKAREAAAAEAKRQQAILRAAEEKRRRRKQQRLRAEHAGDNIKKIHTIHKPAGTFVDADGTVHKEDS